MAVSGLIPGDQYYLTLYTRGFGNVGGRIVDVTTSDTGLTKRWDENYYGEGQGGLFRYGYKAPASGSLTLTFNAVNSGNTWHHYAFSNESALDVYIVPSPAPGGVLDFDVPLSWDLVGDVDDVSYSLKVSTDPEMTDLIVNQTGMQATSFVPELDYHTNYYWQVTVFSNSEQLYSTDVMNFTTPQAAIKLLEWKFEETEGLTASQTALAAGGDGELIGFNDPSSAKSRVRGLVGNALYLDGADEHIDISSAYAYMPTGAGQQFSVSGYICTYDDYGPLFSMRNSGDETPVIDIALGADGVQDRPGQICILVRDNAGSISYKSSGVAVNDGKWHSIIVSRTSQEWLLYIDGIVRAEMPGVASGAVTLDWMGIGASLKWIADNWQSWNSHYRYFNGIIDEFAVWDGQLTAMQIKSHVAELPQNQDISWDRSVDVEDLDILAEEWLEEYTVPVQEPAVLDDMESYSAGETALEDYWAYVPESGYGQMVLSIVDDPDGVYSKVLRMAYNFNGKLHAHVPLVLNERRVNSSLYTRLGMRLKKMSGCDVSSIIIDFYDGRYNVDPLVQGMHSKGRITYAISNLPAGQWQELELEIPNTVSFTSCKDLYQIVLSIQDGGADSGIILVDSIWLSDNAVDYVKTAGCMLADIDGDFDIDLVDFTELSESWLDVN